jgi:hypothetical protein
MCLGLAKSLLSQLTRLPNTFLLFLHTSSFFVVTNVRNGHRRRDRRRYLELPFLKIFLPATMRTCASGPRAPDPKAPEDGVETL